MKFEGENNIKFMERFPDDHTYLQYLSEIKWSKGFTGSKCGHQKHTIRKKNLAGDCYRCHHIESPTADTLFHSLQFGIRKAFMIVFEMSATTKGLSSSQLAKHYEISRQSVWAFCQNNNLDFIICTLRFVIA